MMRKLLCLAAMLMAVGGPVPPARAHAFLDHADPPVGSSLPAAPAVLTLWFTQELEPAFSTITVVDGAGRRVDLGNAAPPAGHPAELQVGLLRPLPPGTYRVTWHVVSVDTHPTEGSFTFRVGGG